MIDGNNNSGVARFTLDSDSNKLVGTLQSNQDSYRLFNLEDDPDLQLVYKLSGDLNANQRDSLRLTSEDNARIREIERRHIKANIMSRLDPKITKDVMRDNFDFISLVGGDLGRVDLTMNEEQVPSAILELLKDYAA